MMVNVWIVLVDGMAVVSFDNETDADAYVTKISVDLVKRGVESSGAYVVPARVYVPKAGDRVG